MPRKKPESKVIEVDFGNKEVMPEFDFSFVFSKDDYYAKKYGLRTGQELCFRYVEEFFDGDFLVLFLQDDTTYYYGFGYSLTNSILIGLSELHPVPKREIKQIGKLVNPIKLDWSGGMER